MSLALRRKRGSLQQPPRKLRGLGSARASFWAPLREAKPSSTRLSMMSSKTLDRTITTWSAKTATISPTPSSGDCWDGPFHHTLTGWPTLESVVPAYSPNKCSNKHPWETPLTATTTMAEIPLLDRSFPTEKWHRPSWPLPARVPVSVVWRTAPSTLALLDDSSEHRRHDKKTSSTDETRPVRQPWHDWNATNNNNNKPKPRRATTTTRHDSFASTSFFLQQQQHSKQPSWTFFGFRW